MKNDIQSNANPKNFLISGQIELQKRILYTPDRDSRLYYLFILPKRF